MQATVLRNGSHLGHNFIEVEADGVRYAVPVSTELELGTVVDIVTTVAEVPKAPTADLTGTDVSTPTKQPLEVPESPLAASTVAPDEVSAPKQGKLPDGFPGLAALNAADINTFAQVRKADLDDIPGIGPATAEKIREAF